MTIHDTMSAVIVRAPMEFAVETVPIPPCPEDGLLLKVHTCGLCGSDLRTLRSGHHRVQFPWIIGHEISGTVVQSGTPYQGLFLVGEMLAVAPLAFCGGCEFCKNGQFELCENYREIAQAWPGGFAEYIALPGDYLAQGTIQPIPAGLSPELAAIAEPIASCVHAQEKGQVGLGDTVVIIGAGPIGCIHTSLARVRGADKIIVADIQESRLKLSAPFQPDFLINAVKVDLVSEVEKLTHGRGASVVITANPVPITQIQAVEMARKGGRILLFGGLPPHQSKPGIDMNLVHYRALHLIGTTIFAPRHYHLALKLLSSNRIPGENLITHRFPLADFETGVKLALEGKVLKAIFRMDASGEF